MTFEKAVHWEGLEKKPALFKKGAKQIAVFCVDGKPYAVDNRCPHEGYPLTAGSVDGDCVLTCNWHNWKFQLHDGACIRGGDHVRAYPAKVEEGYVWLDLSSPNPTVVEARILDGLKVAFEERDYGRIARETARLKFENLDPKTAIRKAIEWHHDKLEYGCLHAYPATADWLLEADRYEGDFEKELICYTEAIDHLADDALRHPVYAYARSEEPFEVRAFLNAVETQNAERAEALIANALQAGFDWSGLEPYLVEAAFAHYNNFGHSLIYIYKARTLLDKFGPEMTSVVILPIVRRLCHATREDLLPEYRGYAQTLAEMPELRFEPTDTQIPAPRFPASLTQIFAWIQERASTHSVLALYDTLLQSCALNMLHFDESFGSSYTRPVSQNIDWLDFTHAITMANAVRRLCSSYPQFWKQGLLQIGCFIGRNAAYLDLTTGKGWDLKEDRTLFMNKIHEFLLDHGKRDPIIAAHYLKTTRAVEEELSVASEPCAEKLLISFNRLVHSEFKQKHVRRSARQAISLVRKDYR